VWSSAKIKLLHFLQQLNAEEQTEFVVSTCPRIPRAGLFVKSIGGEASALLLPHKLAHRQDVEVGAVGRHATAFAPDDSVTGWHGNGLATCKEALQVRTAQAPHNPAPSLKMSR
jgi:hypothetical protein